MTVNKEREVLNMEESKITYISVDKLHPHPDNPRKDIGDITELADSIRQNGIYQNLTVIPSTGVLPRGLHRNNRSQTFGGGKSGGAYGSTVCDYGNVKKRTACDNAA